MLNFNSPHVHPQSLDSASTPAAFAAKEVELGTTCLTCTDHGSLGAAYSTYSLAKKNNLIPCIGLEGYVRPRNCSILDKFGIQKTSYVPKGSDKAKWAADYPGGTYIEYAKYFHATLGFRDYNAYLAGVRLLSKADDFAELHGSERKPIFDWTDIEELAATNTTLGSGCLVGMIGRHLINPSIPGPTKVAIAKAYFDKLYALFGDRFFVEVMPHACTHNYVKGVFIEVANSVTGEVKTLKYHFGKKLKTLDGEIDAKDLAAKWGKDSKGTLVEVKDYSKWIPFDPPLIIVNVEKKDNFYQNECSPAAPGGDIQYGVNRFVLGMAKQYNVPVIPSDDAHFSEKNQKVVQDVRLAQSGGWRFYNSYNRQDSAEAFEFFKNSLGVDEKTFEGWVNNSYAWAEGFKGFKFDNTIQLPNKFFPEDTLAHTRHLIEKHGRMPKDDSRYIARLKKELDLFHRNGTVDLLSYFFVDEEVCNLYSEKRQLTGPARGSGAGTILAYLLGITSVDPIKYDLSLDRFLTHDRIASGKLPDLDLDLPSRGLLLEFLEKRYGDCYAQISVMTTLKLKNAIKDVSRYTMGFVPQDIEEWTKKMEVPPQGLDDYKFVMGWTDDEGTHEGSIERDKALKAYVNRYPDQWKSVLMALSLPRQRGRHASAFIIASKPVSSFIPMTTVSDVKVTSFTGTEVEAIGGLKMDWLVVSCLNDIQECLKIIARQGKQEYKETVVAGKKVPPHRLVLDPVSKEVVDVWDLPPNLDVFKDISSGNTETVFQFNTPSAVQWLKYFNYIRPNGEPAINSIQAMAAFTALDRPGPLNYMVTDPENTEKKHNFLVEYARRVRGLPGSKDVLPVFDKLLPETNSLIVFQEQLQRVYQELTGCSGADAEKFRSISAKKKPEEMAKSYTFFMEEASKKIGQESAQQVWDGLTTFSKYSFNKSHSISYCIISYACAWLKHYYPLEWWTAVLTHADKEEVSDKFWPYCCDKVLLPDLNLSKPVWTIEGDKIRAPISLLYGIGEAAHEQLMKYAPYRNKEHFCQSIIDYKKAGENGWGRSAVNIGTVYTLLVAGCMDNLFDPKNTVGENLDDYQKTLIRLTKAEGKKIAKSKVNYPILDYIGRYQIKKDVLPIFGDDLRPHIESPNLFKVDEQVFYRYRDWSYQEHSEVQYEEQIMSGQFMEECEKVTELYGGQKCVIVGYIEDCEVFNYGPNKSKEAKKFRIETCGIKREMVYWTNKDQRIPRDILDVKKGSVAILVLSRYNADSGFAIKKIEVVRQPQEKKESKDA